MAAHLSPDVKMFLQDSAPSTVCLVVALDRAARADDERHVESTGCKLRGSVGDVMTLECDRTALRNLLAWPRLVSVELSGPLYPEPR
jgi:hypothetical protein